MVHDELLEHAFTTRQRLVSVLRRTRVPELAAYTEVLSEARRVLHTEDPSYRPRDTEGRPGGLLYLRWGVPTVIVPDLHARMDFFLRVLLNRSPRGYTFLEELALGLAQIVCVGDAFHAEGRAAARWKLAFQEFTNGYRRRSNMDEEMRESMGLMEMVLLVKSAFPNAFHFLKGNHENIANEHGDGNYPFGKFAYEGAMVTQYIRQFYGDEFLAEYAAFEKQLPLLAVGSNFIVSHAEPRTFYPRDAVINYRRNADVVYDLTWTNNDAAEPGSVAAMLEHYLPGRENTYYFGGHRPITGSFHTRAGGRYVQIHDPTRFIIANLPPDREIDLNRDIYPLDENLNQLLG
jgi:hypothetical protein